MKKQTLLPLYLAVAGALCAAPAHDLPQGPSEAQNLKLAAPVSNWDDAIPLGNGLMGGLLWGDGQKIRLSLDRGDLWDERTHGEKEWWKKYTYAKGAALVKAGRSGDLNSWWDSPYNGVTPTKLPAGRLEVNLAPGIVMKTFELNLATAEGWVHFADKKKLAAFFSANERVALMRIPGKAPLSYELIPSGATPAGNGGPSSGGAVKKLGYPAAKHGSAGNAKWYVQNAVGGFQYCVCVETVRLKDETLLAVAVTATNDSPDPLTLAKNRCHTALTTGYQAMLTPHVKWWSAFWNQSAIMLPAEDQHILNQYYLIQYFYGAASRQGAPPMPLQGVWTADNGGLPPWKGDYHNDLNTQMTYIAYHGAGHFEQGLCYLDFLWNRREVFQGFARNFYGTKGLACPGVMSLSGQPLGGWGQYSMSPTMSAWSAHLFYLHWRYTMDDKFLKEKAYPWASDVGECMLALLKPNKDGILVLPLSTSPEIFGNSARAWLEPNSNYDLMSLRMLFLSLQEMADAMGENKEAAKWAKAASDLGPYHTDASDKLLIDSKTPLPESHRHLSNIIGLFPFNLINKDGSEKDRQIIEASIKDWDSKGTQQWTGYSFSWYSSLLARVGHPEAALRNLDIYASAFVTRNGFHVNGDQTKSGFSSFTYRPFTLEGNFLAAQAVQEMLLQSWSPTPGKRDTEEIRVFPAMPWRWHDASFRDLHAEGGHRVSAIRENNATTWLRVTAGRDATIRVRDNFDGQQPKWNQEGIQKIGSDYVIHLKKGQVLEATLAKPDKIPPAPDNLAEKVLSVGPNSIRTTKLPLRIGADSTGASRFHGDLARVLVVNRVLSEKDIARLASPEDTTWNKLPQSVVVLDGASHQAAKIIEEVTIPASEDKTFGKVFRMDGKGYLEIPHADVLNCHDALTLSAWVKPTATDPLGARIIDKTEVGGSAGYLLDTWPGGRSIRLITQTNTLIAKDLLPLNEWSHVAATVDGETGQQLLYLKGKKVAESP